jgi:pimeloyl-ACP methyl ester carboxylesterase
MVQGVGCVGEGWRPQIGDLSRDHQVAWLDNRGIGASAPFRGTVSVEEMAQDCRQLLDHMGWNRVHLVGHSMGGVIVQQVARADPSRVASISLLSTVRCGRAAALITLPNLVVSLRSQFGTERKRWLTLAEMAFPRTYLATLSEEARLRLVQMIFCRDFLAAPAIVRKQIAALWHHRGGEMSALRAIPALIVTGALDIVVRSRYSDDLLAHLPKARLVRFADAGHGVPLQHADEVSALLRRHFAAHS